MKLINVIVDRRASKAARFLSGCLRVLIIFFLVFAGAAAAAISLYARDECVALEN